MSQNTDSRWRIASRQAIQECLSEHHPTTAKEFRRVSRDYYPFGERKYHPYKMWLDEVRKAANVIEPPRTKRDLRDYWANSPLKKGST